MSIISPAQQVVQKLWKFCNVLRDDGLSYPDYVEQLTYLLFLKMADERSRQAGVPTPLVPQGLDWESLLARRGKDQHAHYSHVLTELGNKSGMLGLIFRRAQNKIQDPAKLEKLIVDLVNREVWTALDAASKGDAYEGLLDKTSQDSKSGAGQYFTPRPLIEAIVEVVRPELCETICDPAAGTAGFLLAAHQFILKANPSLTSEQSEFLRLHALRGTELVDSIARLGAMNLLLHGVGPIANEAVPPISVADSISLMPTMKYDIILTNPPFGKKSTMAPIIEDDNPEVGRIAPLRSDFFVYTANKQLNFLQHILAILKEGGRAAVVVPDNVLFEGGAAEVIRRRLMEQCNLHTLLRLPTGIFYAQGVKSNVIFFDKEKPMELQEKSRLWVYDLRSQVKVSLRTKPLKREDLEDFILRYEPYDRSKRAENDRWQCFSHSEILSKEGARLDIDLIEEGLERLDLAQSSEYLTEAIINDLTQALDEIRAVSESLFDS